MRTQLAFRPMVALCLAAVLGAMSAGPILARSDGSGGQSVTATHRPDASIKTLTSHYAIPGYTKFTWDYTTGWLGVGVYNTTATYQTAQADWQDNCCNEKHSFKIAIKNNGSVSDRFKVKATGSGLVGWTVTYFKGTTNITSAVVAGTYRTPLLAPGSQSSITAKLAGSIDSETLAGSRLVTVASVAQPTRKDAVKFRLHLATWCYC